MVVSRQHRSHEGVAQITNLLVLLLLSVAILACNGRTAVENDLGVAATASAGATAAAPAAAASQPKTSINNGDASAATSSAASAPLGKEHSSNEGRKFDLSFSHIGYGGRLPDPAAAIELSPSPVLLAEESDQQLEPDAPPHDDAVTAGPPLELGLRECSLGDDGVAELARSPWVTGSLGLSALSLRHNQVRYECST